MKRYLLSAIIIFSIFIISLSTIYFWIRQDVQHNIEIAERKYHIKGEKALYSINNPAIKSRSISPVLIE